MNQLLEKAVEAVRRMPPDEQEKVARLMLSFAAVSCAATPTSKLRFASSARENPLHHTRELMFCSMSVPERTLAPVR